jgi:WD40 repeat protein
LWLATGADLVAVPFNLDKLELAGGSVPLIEGVLRAGGALQYAVSDSGTLAYIPGIGAGLTPGQRNLVCVDQKEKEEPIAAASSDYRAPRISPDGTKTALAVYSGNKSDIWIWDIARESITRLTFGEASMTPLRSLDGKRVAFASGAATNASVYWKAADGTGEDEKLGSAQDRTILPWVWSKDGKTLVTMDYTSGGFDIGSLSMEGDHKWSPLLREKYIELHLDRSVAIKVLPAEAVADPERKRRFVQEAKSASALNHPNIIHIYDIDTGGRHRLHCDGVRPG